MTHHQEVITLHVGKAGVHFGETFWEMLREEHQIDASGKLSDTVARFPGSMFGTSHTRTCIPRAVLHTQKKEAHGAFDIHNFSDIVSEARNNYFKGRANYIRREGQEFMNKVRRQMESCECMQGFLICHASGGGTGSGFCSEVLYDIRDAAPKKIIMESLIYPSPTSVTGVFEAYNSIFSMADTGTLSDVSLLMDNQQLGHLSEIFVNGRAGYALINQLVAYGLSGITAPLRFAGESSVAVNFEKIATATVPLPKMKYCSVGLSPLLPPGVTSQTETNTIVSSLFNTWLSSMHPKGGLLMGSMVLSRGDISPLKLTRALTDIMSKGPNSDVKVVPWVYTNNQGCTPNPPLPLRSCGLHASANVSGNLSVIANNLGVVDLIKYQYAKFLALLYRKAYIWHLLDAGAEELLIQESRETVRALLEEYREIIENRDE